LASARKGVLAGQHISVIPRRCHDRPEAIPSPQRLTHFQPGGSSQSLDITNSDGVSIFFHASHYQLTTQLNTPTILKRQSLKE
jgi:hypothetical protein